MLCHVLRLLCKVIVQGNNLRLWFKAMMPGQSSRSLAYCMYVYVDSLSKSQSQSNVGCLFNHFVFPCFMLIIA